MHRPVARATPVLTALLALLLPLTLTAPAPAAEPAALAADDPGLVVTGYAVGSASDRLVARNAAGLDTLTVAGVGLHADGDGVGRPTADMTRLLRTAHAEGLRAELVLSNYSNRLGGFDTRAVGRLLLEPAHVRHVARVVARVVTDQGWDGVNVDLESMRRRHGRGLVSLLEALRARLPQSAALSVDVSARTSREGYLEGGYRLGEVADVVDLVQLMTYDQHGPTWSGPGPVGGLDWQRRSVTAALEQVPAAMLDLGVAGYGYTWPRRGTGHTVLVRRARQLVEADGATARWRAAEGEWAARLSDGTRLWWSDARSYAVRRDLAAELGLHGLAVWRVGSADTLPAPG